MRDFGFWVRVIAITQLFCIVLANYGDQWLSSDNPLVTVTRPRPVVVEAPVKSAHQPDLWSSGRSDFSSGPAAQQTEPDSAEEWLEAGDRDEGFDSGLDESLEDEDDGNGDGSLWGSEAQP